MDLTTYHLPLKVIQNHNKESNGNNAARYGEQQHHQQQQMKNWIEENEKKNQTWNGLRL